MTAPVDLPEPRRRETTPAERQRRQLAVLTTVLWLVIGYAFIHKLLVPLCLKLTALRTSAYSAIDIGFFYFLAFGIAFAERKPLAVSFLAGGGIAYGAVEVWLVGRGVHAGWLAFSKCLSAVPFAAICIVVLSGPYEGKRPGAAWLGAAAVAATKLFLVGLR